MHSSAGKNLFVAFAAMCSLVRGGQAQVDFYPDVSYDTLVSVGAAGETNPLLIYDQAIHVQLVGPTTVVYADNAGGRLTLVDLMSGEGWEVTEGGQSGPGEFGGTMPRVTESNGILYTLAIAGQTSRRSLDGGLLGTDRLSENESRFGFSGGILESGVIISLHESDVNWERRDVQTLHRGVLVRA